MSNLRQRDKWMKFSAAWSTRTPAFREYPSCPVITHTIDSYLIPSQNNMTKSNLQIKRIWQILNFLNKLYMRHTYWSCLIRYVNMKWIRWVVLILSTDWQTNKVKPVYLPFNFVEAKGITRAVRDCLICPYARISECLVSQPFPGNECKAGHCDPIPVKCELKLSCNPLSINTNTQVGISNSIWTTRQ